MILWDKRNYSIKLRHGEGHLLSEPMHGLIQHIIVIPEHRDTIWSMVIKDTALDPIYMVYDHKGRLDDKEGLPIGVDKPEKINIEIFDTTSNEEFKLIFKVREAL